MTRTRLTARGTGLLVAGPVLVTLGFAGGYPDLAVLGCAAIAAVLTAGGYVLWQPRLAVARVVDPDRVMRGEPSQVTLTVRNDSRLRAATVLGYDRCGPVEVPVPLLRLRPGGVTTVGYPVPTDRRGVVTIGPVRVARADPLGLAHSVRLHGGPDTAWVYPRAYPLTAVPVGIARSLDGRVARVPNGSITFDTLREYVVGDELRHVHWRTTARIGELMVREHVDTSLPRLVVLLDDRAGAHPDPADGTATSFEGACEAAASLVLAAQREDLPLALCLASGAVAGGDGRRHADPRPMLDLLAEAGLSEECADLGPAAARLRHRPLGDTLVYLTGRPTPAELGVIGALRGRYAVVVAGSFAPGRPGAPATGGPLLLTADDGAGFATAWDGVPAW